MPQGPGTYGSKRGRPAKKKPAAKKGASKKAMPAALKKRMEMMKKAKKGKK